MPIPVVLDVDTGVDDALALLLAVLHPDLELRAVTCVQGNTNVDQVGRNTLTVLDAAGAPNVPVAIGADRPLLEPPGPTRLQHGTDGMAGLGRFAPSRRPDPRPATQLLCDTLDPQVPVVLVTLGPLTNIAALLTEAPRAATVGISRVVTVGGFNVAHDPEAAAAVLSALSAAGVPVTYYGSDVFYSPLVSAEQAWTLPDMPAAGLAADLLRFSFARYGAPAATIGDAGAVCAVLDPSGLDSSPRTVRVELTGPDRGRLVEDPAGASVDLAVAVDGPHYANVWLGAFG